MSETTDRMTGATPEQIEAAVDRRIRWVMGIDDVSHAPVGTRRTYRTQFNKAAPDLVPPNHRIIANNDDHLSPATAEAVRRLQTLAQAARAWREAEAIEHPDLAGECRQLEAITDLIDAIDAITDADLALLGATP